MKILVTGGAGFIGTHLVRRLLQDGAQVSILDNFSPQVHLEPVLPKDLAGRVTLHCADVADASALTPLLRGPEVLVHLAAETGTGQSMYEVERYTRTNIQATAQIFHALANDPKRTIAKVVVASSRAVYGEGKYRCSDHGVVYPKTRSVEALGQGRFEPQCPICGKEAAVLSTDEAARYEPTSFYGLTKQVQEQTVMLFCRALGLSGYALRYQNVYGPGQALHNPYTGILAIFSGLARAGKRIEVFEDGNESRDFVYIDDVVDATLRCLDPRHTGVGAYNVGSGVGTRVLDVARLIAARYGNRSEVTINGAFRVGDIRHNIADLTRSREALGFEPKWRFAEGLTRFFDWADRQVADSRGYEKSLAELTSRGLMHGR